MAERKQIVIPKKFKEKYGDKIPIWSYSKVSSIDECTWCYYLSRIKKCKQFDNIYNLCGTVAHDILQGLYEGKIQYKDMLEKFESDFLNIEISNYKFSNDTERNLNMRNKYKYNVSHFFKNHIMVQSKVKCEPLIWIDVKGNIFMGYIDAIHKEDNCYVITDYKTSSISGYKGKNQEAKARQLLLYSLGINQMGVPLDKIKARWNFLKYTNVHIKYKLKSGKEKEKDKIVERCCWVKEVKSQLKKDIIMFYNCEEWEADIKLAKCIQDNDLSSLDENINKNYTLSDAYMYVDVTEESINDLENELIKKIEIIKSKGKVAENWIREDELNQENTYFCSVLCGVRRDCQYYKDYMKSLEESSKEEVDILKELDGLL